MQILSNQQMRMVDTSAIEDYHIPSIVLMEHASMGIFEKLKQQVSKDSKILVVCGVGNNGGDGLALARLLHIDGYDVKYALVEDFVSSQDALVNLQIVESMGLEKVHSVNGYDVIVDAIFGTGLTRNVESKAKEWIDNINQSGAKIYSIDIPSGICSNTAEVLGCAVKADVTYTIARGKIGLYLYPGSEYAHQVEYIDLHVPQSLFSSYDDFHLIDKEYAVNYLPIRVAHSHKGSYGRVLAVGGSRNMSGSITMAIQAALRSGCGLMTAAIPISILHVLQSSILESMWIPLLDRKGFVSNESISSISNISNYDSILIGCGIGRHADVIDYVRRVMDSNVHCIIDADALVALKVLKAMYNQRHNVILTPHLKEFADFMDVPLEEVIQHRMQYVDLFTKMYPNWILVLKSETTIIAFGDKRYINTSGNNGLAVGGSGDVLAGIITGMLAQCKDCVQASIVSVFVHGYIADQLLQRKSAYSILPTDIIHELEQVLLEMGQ